MRWIGVLFSAFLVGLVNVGVGLACTTVAIFEKDRAVIAHNFDWYPSEGLIFINKRNVGKMSWLGSQGVSWASKYGSVTFSQFMRDTAVTGANEKGLMGALLILRGSRYPSADQRKTVNNSEWMQYNLDNFSTVAEVVANAERLRVVGRTPLHYFFADASGDAAVIEFLDGRQLIHHGEDMPVKALANSTYSRSMAAYRRFRRTGVSPAEEAKQTGVLPPGFTSLDRFVRGASERPKISDPIARGFSVLNKVKQGNTRWQLVYDLTNGEIHFKTNTNPKLRYIRLTDFDFSCRTPVKILDITASGSGNMRDAFVNYSRMANRALVEVALRLETSAFKDSLADHAGKTSSCRAMN